MEHSFDIDIAKEYGMLEAVLLKHIWFWVSKNKANGTHYHDGCFWTYMSIKAFTELFPYVSTKKIRNALAHLLELNLIRTGNFNNSAYDRTLWYTITELGASILLKNNFHLSKKANGSNEKGEPIPDINTDINTDINKYIVEIVEYLNKKLGTNYRSTSQNTRSHIKARLEEGFKVDDFKKVIDIKYEEWKDTDMESYLRPQTLFGTKFESYLNQKAKATSNNNNKPSYTLEELP